MTGCLLDSCTLIWLASAPDRLSAKATAALELPNNRRYLSMASVWEISLKYRTGKLPLPQPPRYWIEEQTRLQNIEILDLDRESVYRSSELPPVHNDPFDRLIAADGLIRRLAVITPDQPFAAYGCETIW